MSRPGSGYDARRGSLRCRSAARRDTAQSSATAPSTGGFGGGGGVDGPDEQETRVAIARMSAALSTIDRNPKNLAVVKKLEEPNSLHFPAETPLEDVLKRI